MSVAQSPIPKKKWYSPEYLRVCVGGGGFVAGEQGGRAEWGNGRRRPLGRMSLQGQ